MSAQGGSSGLQEANQKYMFMKQINKTAITANDSSITLPLGAHLVLITMKETTGNAITGGIDIGTTNAGTDVVSGFAVAGSFYGTITDAAILKRVFLNAQQLFIQAHTSWNAASLNINFIYVSREEYRI